MPQPPPFTKPITSMNKQQLKNLCDHFGQANDGLVVTLRERLRRYLRDHQEALENNPNYRRLYPRHRGQGLQQPPNREEEPDNEEDQSQHDNFNDREERDTASSFSSFYGCAEGQDNEPNVLSPPPPSSRTLSTHHFDAHQCENQPEVYQGFPPAAHITEGTSNSSRKRPPRVPGMLAQSASYTVPDQIRKKFSAEGGWASHIPLTFLTDKFCAQKNGVSVDMINNSLSVDPNSDQIITTSQSLPIKNETDLTNTFPKTTLTGRSISAGYVTQTVALNTGPYGLLMILKFVDVQFTKASIPNNTILDYGMNSKYDITKPGL
ncbi:hypothetical protein CVT25_014170 [Psilocybe cyanescens]|uniref:SAP domain-containing protein n=1 Tax=Psilocybe cyanescens TaxID=93625 RepID=A0A409XUY7_PSICY|nr:hypothetical protein CVT25_014170 [Psilocybe cyanescens]